MSNYRAIATALFFLLIVTAMFSATGRADDWAPASKRKFYAANQKYYLEVIPASYFGGRVNNKKSGGDLRRTNTARAVFYARHEDGTYVQRAEFPLLNKVSPVSAVVSNNGEYFVTFDNWEGVGQGDDVVAIYHSDGSLVKKFALNDLLTESDIKTLSRTTTSIWWGRNHYIDDSAGLLVLRVVSNRKRPSDQDAQFHELKIELANGRVLEPKRDLIPQL